LSKSAKNTSKLALTLSGNGNGGYSYIDHIRANIDVPTSEAKIEGVM
jgi:hypothetical protein